MSSVLDAPQQPPPELMTPADSYGWLALARNAVPFIALLAAAPILAARSLWAAWSLTPLIGLFAYRLTFVMHDCAHGTLFLSPRLNRAIGRAIGAITGIDFQSYRTLHWKHHRRYGLPDDPQGFHYLGLQHSSRPARLWHLIKPLLAANLGRTLQESVLNPRNLRRGLRTGEAMTIVGAQLLMLIIVTGAGRRLSLAILPFVSSATFALFLSQLRGIAEHGVSAQAQAGWVRSHAPNWIERIFLYDLHFNYHAEHHAWPQCPSRHLPTVHRKYFATGTPLDSSMVATIAALAGR